MLYASNSCIRSPITSIVFGTIFLLFWFIFIISGQLAGNFSFSTNVTAVTKNTYNRFYDLLSISEQKKNREASLQMKNLHIF